MFGVKSRVASQIAADEPRDVFLHCFGHSWNLAMSDTIKFCKATRDAVDVTHEISKLVKFSPKRNTKCDSS